MKQNLITDVIQGMLPYLNNAQTEDCKRCCSIHFLIMR